MNSERRHELQENALAAYLGRFSKAIEPYKNIVAIAIAVVAIGGLVMAFYSSTKAENRSDATLQLMQAAGLGDAEVLASVATSYPETPASAVARLYQADQLMARGMQNTFSDQQQAEDLFIEAEGAYKDALAGGTENRLVRSRANYGLARIAEARGQVDEAIGYFEAVVAAEESDAMVEIAVDRISDLKNPATQEFLAWFDKQEFTPPEAALPPSLPTDGLLPDSPDFTFPEISDAAAETELSDEDAEAAMADDLATEPAAASDDVDPDLNEADDSSAESTDDAAVVAEASEATADASAETETNSDSPQQQQP